jgi:hypothetical protein
MSDLEQRLTQLERGLEWPETPDLATPTLARLREAERPPARRRLLAPAGLRRSLALAAVGLLVLAGGVFAAVPGVRDAVLEFFGLQGVTVERRQKLPPLPKLRPLELGVRTTLADARGSLGFEPLLPRAVGEPDAVFVDDRTSGAELSLAYRPRRGLPEARSTGLGLLVGEFRGDLVPDYLGKIAGPSTRVERLRVDGARAIWIEGAPHLFFYRPPDAAFAESRLRVAANVLLLERGNVLLRLEGAFGRERALELARSLRPAG